MFPERITKAVREFYDKNNDLSLFGHKVYNKFDKNVKINNKIYQYTIYIYKLICSQIHLVLSKMRVHIYINR